MAQRSHGRGFEALGNAVVIVFCGGCVFDITTRGVLFEFIFAERRFSAVAEQGTFRLDG